MRATFVESPAFSRWLSVYLDDDGLSALQQLLMERPDAGAVVPGAGGLRKIRLPDQRRQKGKRSGLRVLYYWWQAGSQIWLFTLYDKDEAADLTKQERTAFRAAIKAELAARGLQ